MGEAQTGSQFSLEQVAYWFFRLNGCLTTLNFVVHPDRPRESQRTEADILAVRFPFRCELATSDNHLADHSDFRSIGKTDVIIAEVKRGACKLNGPWTDPHQ